MVVPFISQIETLPLVSCHRTSAMPSPLKSPVPTTDQTVGTKPSDVDERTCVPFISQIATLPLVSRHRMSALPSPLTSPIPTIDHAMGTCETCDVARFRTWVPFISQIATLPLVSRQAMSLLASPSKSGGFGWTNLAIRTKLPASVKL